MRRLHGLESYPREGRRTRLPAGEEVERPAHSVRLLRTSIAGPGTQAGPAAAYLPSDPNPRVSFFEWLVRVGCPGHFSCAE